MAVILKFVGPGGVSDIALAKTELKKKVYNVVPYVY